MNFWRFFRNLSILSILLSQPSSALIIQLRTDWLHDSRSNATPAYVWQNDPEVLRRYGAQQVTNFCVPAAIGTALLTELAYRDPPASTLKLAGYSASAGTVATIDTAKLLIDLATRCHADVKDGTSYDNAVQCAASLYRDSGYPKAQVKLIRPYDYSLASNGIEHEVRRADVQDIRSALAQGYQVIASIATVHWDDSKKAWTKVGSHALNVVGISSSSLFVTNPTRAYPVDGLHPLFDEVSFRASDTPVAEKLPQRYSPIELTGRLINRPNSLTVLAGLLLLRAE